MADGRKSSIIRDYSGRKTEHQRSADAGIYRHTVRKRWVMPLQVMPNT